IGFRGKLKPQYIVRFVHHTQSMLRKSSLFCGLFFTRKLLRTSKRRNLCIFAGFDDEEYLAVFRGGMSAQDAQRLLFEALLFYEHPPFAGSSF
ncbi:MAG: hypothetical protein IKY00_02875, partial [Clostridia bacterium]|nr:hypothetical protein [Clostridia bacterium]